jgi:tetratricopeptide (TPR) repeat protein
MRLVSKTQPYTAPPRNAHSTPPLLAESIPNQPTTSRKVLGWPALVLLLVGLGILGLVINIKIAQVQQEKNQKLTSLYSSAQQVATTGRWSEAISMYQEMEKLASTPEWSFKSKYEQSRTFIKMGSFPEAEKKLKEAEKVCQENPEILRGQNPKEALLLARKVLIEEQKQLEKTGVLTHPPALLDSGQANQTATASTPLDPAETKKRAEMTALFDDSRSLFQKKDYLGALQGLTKLESLSQEYPNFQFGVKKAIITSLLALKRFVEANEKLSEMESIVSSNVTVRESPDVRNLMDAIRQEIQVARSESGYNSSITSSETNQTTQTTSSSENPALLVKGVKWSKPEAISNAGFSRLELVFTDCIPQGNVSLPFVRGLEFYGHETENVAKTSGQATVLSYIVRILGNGPFTIPSFEVQTNKGKEIVPTVSFIRPDKISTSSTIVPDKKEFGSILKTSSSSSELPKDYTSLKENLKKETENVLPPDYSRTGQETDWDRECQGGWWPSSTEVGRYKLAFYQKVGRIWDDVAMIYGARLQAGRVVIKFRIQPDGSVADLRVTQGDATSTLAQVVRPILAKAVGQSGSFLRALKKESPDGFEWQLAFRID